MSSPLELQGKRPDQSAFEPPATPERVVVFRLRTVLAGLGVVFGVAVVVGFIVVAQAGLSLIAIALFFSLALNPGVNFFERRGFRRGSGVGAVFALALTFIAVLGLVLIPPLVEQVTRLIDALPTLVADLTRGHGPLGALERRYHVVERVRAETTGAGSQNVTGAAAPALDLLKGVASTVVGVAVIAFLTLFMLLEGREWRRRFMELVPERSRPVVERVGAGVYRAVGGFVIGNLLASFLAGCVATVILLITGVPYAVPLGLFVALIEVVPYIGPLAATVVLTAVALTVGLGTALVVLALLLTYHMIEGHTLRPMIYGRALKLSALAVLIAILLGTEMAGIFGALAAIPVAGSIQAVITELVEQRASRATRVIVRE